jgi:hypothetical protein
LYDKPSWQSGVSGIPADGHHDLSDVSLFAGDGIWLRYYAVRQADNEDPSRPSSPGRLVVTGGGGTSFGAPAFADTMALVNQKTGSRLGLAAPVVYAGLVGSGLYQPNVTQNRIAVAARKCYRVHYNPEGVTMFAPRVCLWFGIGIGICCGVAAADWRDLSGNWMLDLSHSPAAKAKSESLAIQQTEDTIEFTDAFTDTNGKDWRSVFHCNIDGNQCKVKDQGQNATVTFWYNGLALVMMETKKEGAWVIKKRITLSEDAKTMTVELEHVNPAGGTDTYTYTKQ